MSRQFESSSSGTEGIFYHEVLLPRRGAGTAGEDHEEMDSELLRKLSMSVQELELGVRSNNCLEAANIQTVGQLANCPETELLQIRSFGKTSLREVKRKLQDLGLTLGMNLPLPEVKADADEQATE